MPDALCEGCQAPLAPREYRGGMPRKWCSSSCRQRTLRAQRPEYVARAAERAAERHRRTYVPVIHERVCTICGAGFTAKRPEAMYCSRRCKQRAEHEARKARGYFAARRAENYEAERARIREYRSRKPFRERYPETYAAADQLRAERKLVDAERVAPVEIHDRDGWICQLCDGSIDQVLAWPDPMSASLDHVIPLARGGRHTRDNLQSAHLRCNLQKGDKVA